MTIPNQPQETPSIRPQPEINQQQFEMLLQQRRDNQNLGLGILGGAIGALVGAALWALVTGITNFQIGFMAVGVGFLTGYGVRKLGQGIDKSFGVVGAVLSLAGCLAGNLLVICIAGSKELGIGVFELLTHMTPSVYVNLLKETFSVIDLVFYAIAVYEGFKFSIVRITAADLTH
jgi:hypothetical protein